MALRLTPYLIMDGNAREAVQFYEKALGAQVLGIQTFGEMPGHPDHPIPESIKDRIMHALLKVGDAEMMFSDTFAGTPHQVGTNVSIAIVTNELDRAKAIFEALQEGGQVTMPLQETFWSPAYGQVTDKFGVMFQISVER